MRHFKNLVEPKEIWRPAYYTKPINDYTRGDDVVDFASTFLSVPRGFKSGKPLDFTAWQKWLVEHLYEEDQYGLLRYKIALIGLGRKNGKSLLASTLCLQALVDGPIGQQILCAAGDNKQARLVFDECKRQVMINPILRQLIDFKRDVLTNKKTLSTLKPLATDGDSTQGLGGSLVIADELHAWPATKAHDFWAALTSGSSDRPEAMVIAITTAGENKDSLAGEEFEYGRKVASGEIDDPSYGFFWWAADENADPTDESQWHRANPNMSEGLINVDTLKAAIKKGANGSFLTFMRFYLNLWTRLAGEDFISDFHWQKAATQGDIPLGATVVAGFDGSTSGDSTCLVIQEMSTGNFKKYILFEKKQTDGDNFYIDREEVIKAIHAMFSEYDVLELNYDRSYFAQDLAKLERQFYRRRIVEIPQTAARMNPMFMQFASDIVSETIHHFDWDTDMTRHARNAVLRSDGGATKDKRMSKNKIDLLVGATLCNGARNRILLKQSTAVNQRPIRLA